jgi:hypothetical protein
MFKIIKNIINIPLILIFGYLLVVIGGFIGILETLNLINNGK